MILKKWPAKYKIRVNRVNYIIASIIKCKPNIVNWISVRDKTKTSEMYYLVGRSKTRVK